MESIDLQDDDSGWKPVVVGIRFTDDEKILLAFRIYWWGCVYKVELTSLKYEDGRDVEEDVVDPEHIASAREAVFDHIGDEIAELLIEDEDYEPDYWS